ncbi:MAG: DISARM system phospholipase D-like protein DrmC [Anaerolineae bacterium]|nr:DISARM system phospholipase D-like protein DrmC [Anaerolineae bacterium]
MLVELARELPPGTLNALISALEPGGGRQNLGRFAATPTMREKLRRLEELCGLQPEINTQVIAFALRAAAEAAAAVAVEQRAEIAWTGPATEAVPLRRVDQVIYDMVETAKEEVLLVTYAAYKAERALKALRDATDRGVRVRLVIELAEESGGKISFDGLQGFRTVVPSAQVFFWPLDRRKRSASGSYGAMHAKCLVADRSRAIVSSANLTDYALETNMELGLLVGRPVAVRLAEHFAQLIVRGELISAI